MDVETAFFQEETALKWAKQRPLLVCAPTEAVMLPIQEKKSRLNGLSTKSVAYLENRQGSVTTPRGCTLLPKGRAVERVPQVPRAIFVDLSLGKHLR